jgi:hypothetical protein
LYTDKSFLKEILKENDIETEVFYLKIERFFGFVDPE